MYAVIRTGSKQYRIAAGGYLNVEKVAGNIGDKIELNEVLLVADDSKVQVGQPLVSGAKVTAEIVDQVKGDKVTIFKKTRRHGYALKKGHRQKLTRLRVKDIVLGR